MKYKKKVLIVEAIAWTGENYETIGDFISPPYNWSVNPKEKIFIIQSKGGQVGAMVGTLIVKEISLDGEIFVYPCAPVVFDKMFEAMN